jgi:hypothetical protein
MELRSRSAAPASSSEHALRIESRHHQRRRGQRHLHQQVLMASGVSQRHHQQRQAPAGCGEQSRQHGVAPEAADQGAAGQQRALGRAGGAGGEEDQRGIVPAHGDGVAALIGLAHQRVEGRQPVRDPLARDHPMVDAGQMGALADVPVEDRAIGDHHARARALDQLPDLVPGQHVVEGNGDGSDALRTKLDEGQLDPVQRGERHAVSAPHAQ